MPLRKAGLERTYADIAGTVFRKSADEGGDDDRFDWDGCFSSF
jgi:hypothetical protein